MKSLFSKLSTQQLLMGLAFGTVVLCLPPFLKNYGVYMFTTWLIYVIATMGLNLTVGYAGQKSLGHAAFFGFVLGLLLGFPALRVQTIYLAFATLGFNTAVFLVMRNEEWLTGGTFGLNGIPRPELFGFDLKGGLAYYYFVLAIAVITTGLLWGLLRSPWGKAFQALRDNPIRAESLGVDTRSYTLLSFAIGAVYAGIAGVLFASLVDFIEPAPFAVGASIMMYLMVVVGGSGYFWGPLVGALVGMVVPEWIRDVFPVLANWYLPIFGATVIAMMVWLPDGLLSIPDRIKAKRDAKLASAARANAAKNAVNPMAEKVAEKVGGAA
jgi:branched-chain amino acid transport system permease protein